MIKKEKGITLVALVITIIVLLILAGVTIAMVVGDNGILTRSRQSKFESIESEVQEKIKMAMSDLAADIETEEATNSSVSYKGSDVVTILERTLGSGNIAENSGAGKYKVEFVKSGPTTTNIKSTTGQNAVVIDSNTTETSISIEYNSEALTKSAKKGWTGPLKYSYSLNNYQITEGESSANNNGGY